MATSKGVLRSIYRGLLKESRSLGEMARSRGRRLSDELKAMHKVLHTEFRTVDGAEQAGIREYRNEGKRCRIMDLIVNSSAAVPSCEVLSGPLLCGIVRRAFKANRIVDDKSADDLIADAFGVLRLIGSRKQAIMLTAGSTRSETVSGPCRISVFSYHLPESSQPAYHYFVFGYTVRITNNSDKDTLQLINRHWNICNEDGEVLEKVDGMGVIGQCPMLRPGASFEYSSGCPLNVQFGSMSGHFGMLNLTDMQEFRAVIAPFALSIKERCPSHHHTQCEHQQSTDEEAQSNGS